MSAEFDQAAADRRERIATACLAGLLADPRSAERAVSNGTAPRDLIPAYAREAVQFADALITELDK